jgi:hypothetical protein
MLKAKAKLLQRTLVKDEYGGATEVLNYLKDVNGYLVPSTEETATENTKISINKTAQFICDERITGMNLVVDIGGELYNIHKKANVYSKGCALELVHFG